MPEQRRTARVSRRQFIKYTSLATGAVVSIAVPGCSTARPRRVSANEKLNIAVIGAGGKGSSDTDSVASENIVALCDVDQKTLDSRGQKYPGARLFKDYRKMLE